MDGNAQLTGAAERRAQAGADAEPDYEIGYRRPPRGFRPGVSGNPMGRPRRAPSAARGRMVPAEPTALEHALAEPADRLLDIGPRSVGLARAVVSRLTRRALDDGDVAACRELMRLVAEAEATACERAQLAAERAEAEALAAEAERAAEAAAARAAERRAQDRARGALEALAEDAACDHGVEGMAGADARALALLDAVETNPDKDWPAAVRPWVVEAARAHDPALPRGGDDRPLDLDDPDDALIRLRVARLGYNPGTLPGWFIDAALARRPERPLARSEAAMLALVRQDGDAWPPDWAERLAAVKGSLLPWGEGGARRRSRGKDEEGVRGLRRP